MPDPNAPSPLPADLARALPGAFVVFEGPDGSGKSTQLRRFAGAVRAAGLDPEIVRDPGGTHVGEQIRAILLEHGDEDIHPRTEVLLFMASRAQLVARRIAPALAEGRPVLADRFYASTLAYQGTAGGVPADDILAAALAACGPHRPDLTLIFDVDGDTAAARLSPLLDRMEAKGRAFHERVRAGYHEQADRDPDRVALVDASGTEDDVAARVLRVVHERLTTPRTGPGEGARA